VTPWLFLDIALTLAAIIAFGLYITRPVPEPEGTRRDITINRDQAVGERLTRLRQMQPGDVDVARRDQPKRPLTRRDIEARRASSYLTRGY
jgi:hypothetical protein